MSEDRCVTCAVPFFPQHSWELGGKKTELTSWLQISPIFGAGMVYRWNTFGLELRSLSGFSRAKSSRRFHEQRFISLLPLTTRPAEPDDHSYANDMSYNLHFSAHESKVPRVRVKAFNSAAVREQKGGE